MSAVSFVSPFLSLVAAAPVVAVLDDPIFFPGMPNSQYVLTFLAIEYRKFEVAVHDLHSGEYCAEESFVYEEAIGSGCLNPFLMLLRGAECGAKDDQCLLLRPLSGLTHLLLWW